MKDISKANIVFNMFLWRTVSWTTHSVCLSPNIIRFLYTINSMNKRTLYNPPSTRINLHILRNYYDRFICSSILCIMAKSDPGKM